MTTPNDNKFQLFTYIPGNAANNNVANSVSSIFYQYPFLVPIRQSTGYIHDFYFDNASGSVLYLDTLTGPAANFSGQKGPTGADGPTGATGDAGIAGPTGATGTFTDRKSVV